MSEMVERVARAMCDTLGLVWDCDGGPAREEWELQARAGIEAMREPTQAMLEAGGKKDYPYENAPPETHWRLMIDAALHPSHDRTDR